MEAADQKDLGAKKMKGMARDWAVKVSEKTRKIKRWIKGLKVEGKKTLDETNAKRLLGAVEEVREKWEWERQTAKYSLGENEENIIDNKDINGIMALTDLREQIETEIEYKFKVKSLKLKVIKTQAELMAYTHSSIAAERKAAYRALLEKQKENLTKMFTVYQAVIKNWGYEAGLRGYRSPIEVRNVYNQIPNEVVEGLLAAVEEKKEIFGKYFEEKAKRLGTKVLRRVDLYAPVTKTKSRKSYEEAKEIALESFEGFSEKFRKMAEKIIEEGHVEAYPREGKRGGAFCATVTRGITPYVLLNHTGRDRDVAVMAHELGHGVHSLYAAKQWSSVQQANLPLAETASTLGEVLVFENWKKQEKNKEIRAGMLADKIADAYASILRQSYFVRFEMAAHEKMKRGMDAEELSEEWWQTLKEQFGNKVEIEKDFRYEWAYIPHLVETPFYCYAYAFGELLTLSLYARYLKEPKKMTGVIEKILESRGARKPMAVLKEAGAEVEKKEFWREGFEVIEDWIREWASL